MQEKLRYRGRGITDNEIAFIRELIAGNPGLSRRALSQKLCEAWNWVQPNGTLRDMVCRGLMVALERAGHVELPPHRRRPRNPLAERKVARQRPVPVVIDTTPWRASLSVIRPLDFRQIRRTPEEPLFNSLLEQYHFLSYTQPVGEHLKYIVYGCSRPVACLAWSSAPRHLGPRDRFIGWSAEARRRNIRFIAYNTRFLILPWVRIPHLASHILGRMPAVLSRDWERIYGHPVYFLETFIDPARTRGTCYRAANWVPLGRTTGRGKDSISKRPNRSIKEVFGYPVWKRFRELLGEVG
jgi:Druantia protein DruA